MLDGYPLKKNSWKDWLLMAVTSSLALQFIFGFIVLIVVPKFSVGITDDELFLWNVHGTVYGTIASLPLTLLVIHWRKIPLFNRNRLSKEESSFIRGISKKDWKFLAKYIPISYILYIVGAVIITSLFGESEPINQIAVESLFDYIPLWQIFIMVVIVAPVAEELLFRGILLFPGDQQDTTWLRVLISALLFGLVHNPTDILSFYTYVGMGFIFAYAAKRTGSIEAAIFYHFLNNLFAFLQILAIRSLF